MKHRIWNRMLRGAAHPDIRPAAVWVALYTTMPDDGNVGGVEVVDAAYARIQITQLDASWVVPTDGKTTQTANLVFGPATVGFGRVVGFGLLDASTGGNLLSSFPLVAVGESFRFCNVLNVNFDELNSPDHGFVNKQRIWIIGDDPPAPIVEGIEYYAEFTTGDDFGCSLLGDGNVEDITQIKTCFAIPSGALLVNATESLSIGIGDLNMIMWTSNSP